MKLHKHLSGIALVGVMAGVAPIAAVAQAQPSTPPADQQSAPSAAQVTTEEVDAFVGAFKDVQEIHEDYAAQLAEAADDDAFETLQRESQVKKTEAVEAAPGIDVERYVEILTIAQADPDLSAQIVERLEQ